MLRALLVPSLLIAVAMPAAAVPAQRQPTPASVQPDAAKSLDPTSATMQRTLEAQDKAQKAAAEKSKAWDAKMKKTMSGVCSGC